MTRNLKTAAAAGLLCLSLAVAGAAAAQERPQGPPPPGAGPRGPGGRPGFEPGKMFEQMRQRREERLHDLLQIKPNQEAAFKTFLASVAPPRPDRDGRGGPGGLGRGRERGPDAAPMTTPERLDRMQARMAERQQRFQQMAAATKTFYAVLTPEQRKAFDAMPMMRGGEGGRGGPMGGRMGGGHGFGGPH